MSESDAQHIGEYNRSDKHLKRWIWFFRG